MAVINTNVKALFSQAALRSTERGQSVAMQQLSTGKRINSARDDAAGMAIATRMTHQVRSLNQAVRNAGDAIALIQTAEGATNEITDMMQRMRELAVQAVNDTNDNAQRSYLDLEFQQLKQEIVHISESTEWNGFPVLNGTAGERVGEMPVYKTTSETQFGQVLINPTTLRTVAGANAGEKQTITFTGTPATGVINVGGVAVTIDSNAATNMGSFLTAIEDALTSDPSFGPSSGRSVVADGVAGTLVITYASNDGNVPDTTIDVGSTGVTTAVTVNLPALTQAKETFSSNGKFINSGALSINVTNSGVVTASFVGADGETIDMIGVADAANGTVTFAKASGANARVITDDVVYTLQNSLGASTAFTNRAVSLVVDVSGSIPALRSGDLRINGIDIGASYAADDPFSPINNASGSAIAKAAAINRKAVASGVSTGEVQSVLLTGVPSPGVIKVGGVDVTITNTDVTTAQVAAKMAAAMRSSPLYGEGSGRSITYTAGNSMLLVNYAQNEGNVPELSFQSGSTTLVGLVDTTVEHFAASDGTGVFAKVNENVMAGRAMSGTSVVKGAVMINGYASANITTVLNNPRETRMNVVRAINLISDKTGVVAVDTGSDAKGITLTAADGRNIEVQFETGANADDFGARIGLREGVNAATISLESKIQAPIVLSADSTGDITRAGMVEGNFTKNQAVANTSVRSIVSPSQAQVDSVSIGGTVGAGDTFSVTINGLLFTSDDTYLSPQEARDDLIAQINSYTPDIGVTAMAGNSVGEMLLTSDYAGTGFTLSTAMSSSAGTIGNRNVVPNADADFKSLGKDDLMINGVKIRATNAADDIYSNKVATSSDPSSSAIALANAINSHTPDTGVRAEANPVVSKGADTQTALPLGTINADLFINGIKVTVELVQDETPQTRREKVVEAINQRTGQHGVTASNNGNGVTLSSDGRNLSVWFDSAVKDLTPASFGLEKGGAAAQVSRASFTGAPSGTTATLTINGVEISTIAVTGDAEDMAIAMKNAIEEKVLDPDVALKNIKVEIDPDNAGAILITSTVPGSPFKLHGAGFTDDTTTMSLATVTENSYGNNDITGIYGADETNSTARTLYGTVRMIAESVMLPSLPKPIGAPPSELEKLMRANAKPITIQVGADGFGANSNFMALGFREGTFGGRSSSDMDPPKVGRLAFQVGSSANQMITIDLADFGKNGEITGNITGDVDMDVERRTTRINTREGATAVLIKLDEAMDKVNATRATMGAVMNRLEHVITNLTNVSMNLSASRSQIEDADYAQASTELAKTQIMQQAATAVLAQANTSQQSVLKLLGG